MCKTRWKNLKPLEMKVLFSRNIGWKLLEFYRKMYFLTALAQSVESSSEYDHFTAIHFLSLYWWMLLTPVTTSSQSIFVFLKERESNIFFSQWTFGKLLLIMIYPIQKYYLSVGPQLFYVFVNDEAFLFNMSYPKTLFTK